MASIFHRDEKKMEGEEGKQFEKSTSFFDHYDDVVAAVVGCERVHTQGAF